MTEQEALDIAQTAFGEHAKVSVCLEQCGEVTIIRYRIGYEHPVIGNQWWCGDTWVDAFKTFIKYPEEPMQKIRRLEKTAGPYPKPAIDPVDMGYNASFKYNGRPYVY